jgi:hypothetical protein
LALACVVAGLCGLAWRERAAVQRAKELARVVETQDAEILRLREELGYLTITDPAKVHVLQLPTRETYHWKWRIYLPEGEWTLFDAADQIPPKGYDVKWHGKSTIHAGEFTLEAMVDRDAEGAARFLMFSPHGRYITSIAPEDFERLKQGASWSSLGGDSRNPSRLGRPFAPHSYARDGDSLSPLGGVSRMVVGDAADGPIELLRLRTPNEPFSDEPTFGILLWIEPYASGRMCAPATHTSRSPPPGEGPGTEE